MRHFQKKNVQIFSPKGPRKNVFSKPCCGSRRTCLHLCCTVIPTVYGAESQPKSNLVHFGLKERRLVATVLIIHVLHTFSFMALYKFVFNFNLT